MNELTIDTRQPLDGDLEARAQEYFTLWRQGTSHRAEMDRLLKDIGQRATSAVVRRAQRLSQRA